MLNFARGVIAARKSSEALKTGVALPLTAPDNVLAFERVSEGERVYCYFELGGSATTLEGAELAKAQPIWMGEGATLTDARLELAPYAAAIVRA